MISVVIPLYNRAQVIEQTVKSVLNQTFDAFEVIIVNDGSTDNSLNVVRDKFTDSRIRIVDQENQGVSVARNRGVKESRYEYIAFLDADDEWDTGFLEKVIEGIEKVPNAAIYGTSSLHTDYVTKEFVDSTIEEYRNKIVKVDCFQNIHALPHTSAIVVRKEALYKVDKDLDVFPIGMKMHQDWACFFRLALIEDVVYIGNPLGIRYNNVAGQVTGLSFSQRKHIFPSVIRYYNLLTDFYIANHCYNKYFWPFLRYKLRGIIKTLIRNDVHDMVQLFCGTLNKGILNRFEIGLYENRKNKKGSILFIDLNKIYLRLTNPGFKKV